MVTVAGGSSPCKTPVRGLRPSFFTNRNIRPLVDMAIWELGTQCGDEVITLGIRAGAEQLAHQVVIVLVDGDAGDAI